MLTLPHTLIAVILVKYLPNPILALLLAPLSHFFLDFYIVHWNPHLYTEHQKSGRISKNSWFVILLDGFLALGICLYILFRYWPDLTQIALFAGAIFLATLPDTIEIPYYFFNFKGRWLKDYINFQHRHQSNGSFFWGLLTQLILVFISLFFIFR